MRIPEVYAPGTLDEALALKAEHGSSLKPLAGGTDMIPGIRSGACTAEKLLDLSRIDDLRGIRENGTGIDIGALATHARVAESETVRTHLPLLAEACGSVGSVQIRNLGTVGGNLSNASPAADSIPPLIVLGAACKIRSASDGREVLMSAYCTCPGGTCLSPRSCSLKSEYRRRRPGTGVSTSNWVSAAPWRSPRYPWRSWRSKKTED